MPQRERKLFYNIVRPTAYAAIHTFYKVSEINTENADTNKPTLIIANHTNAAIDPLIILFSLVRATYFLPRGDVFNSGFKRWLFNQFNMIPIFRKEEGEENRHKNEETFKRIYSLFDINKLIVIYSEGSCIQEKRVRPFRKGTPKIAFEYAHYKNSDSVLQFVPTALNYENWNKFNSHVWIEFGKAFTLKDANIDTSLTEEEQYYKFSEFAHNKLKELVIAINDPDFNNLEIELLDLYNKDLCNTLNGQLDYSEVRLEAYRRIANAINEASAKEKDWLLTFHKEIKDYQTLLKNLALRNINITNPKSHSNHLLSLIFLLISSPLFIMGFVLNGIQFIYPLKFANKKVKFKEFEASAKIIMSYVMFLISYIIYYIVFSLMIGSFLKGIAIIPITYLLGRFARKWWVKLKHMLGDYKFMSIKQQNSTLFEKITNLKKVIDEKYWYFKKEYYLIK